MAFFSKDNIWTYFKQMDFTLKRNVIFLPILLFGISIYIQSADVLNEQLLDLFFKYIFGCGRYNKKFKNCWNGKIIYSY